ncbi:hypothetical protein BDZ85DRAFT_285574 [Elsinoe ampelina]|uniref:DUF7907 domain-containing protein n=1 Tax=Elsinoe ampelina TaxID=302913 RepID=A0A6A6G0H8_9PEZI|nr:hypothetical protein BDZ85DRAFT_285574 [Elsinoe ampelina]
MQAFIQRIIPFLFMLVVATDAIAITDPRVFFLLTKLKDGQPDKVRFDNNAICIGGGYDGLRSNLGVVTKPTKAGDTWASGFVYTQFLTRKGETITSSPSDGRQPMFQMFSFGRKINKNRKIISLEPYENVTVGQKVILDPYDKPTRFSTVTREEDFTQFGVKPGAEKSGVSAFFIQDGKLKMYRDRNVKEFFGWMACDWQFGKALYSKNSQVDTPANCADVELVLNKIQVRD